MFSAPPLYSSFLVLLTVFEVRIYCTNALKSDCFVWVVGRVIINILVLSIIDQLINNFNDSRFRMNIYTMQKR